MSIIFCYWLDIAMQCCYSNCCDVSKKVIKQVRRNKLKTFYLLSSNISPSHCFARYILRICVLLEVDVRLSIPSWQCLYWQMAMFTTHPVKNCAICHLQPPRGVFMSTWTLIRCYQVQQYRWTKGDPWLRRNKGCRCRLLSRSKSLQDLRVVYRFF